MKIFKSNFKKQSLIFIINYNLKSNKCDYKKIKNLFPKCLPKKVKNIKKFEI